MWLDVAIALSCSGGGVVCGWIMHAISGFGNDKLVKHVAASIVQGDKVRSEPISGQRISEVAQRLKAYAQSMAADVDAHQTKVQAVNDRLIGRNDSSPESVIQAVGQLIEANQAMQAQLRQAQDRIHAQTMQIESAERRAETDALTRVPNRRAFDNHIQKRQALGAGRAGTLALLDVDHFKQFNDLYGHRAGDEVLKIVASVLHTRLHGYGLVCRFGGEEFAVILDGYSIDQAKGLVESARLAIGQRDIEFEDKQLRVSTSAGVAELLDGESIEDWLQRADDAMYRSKQAGRNCGHWMDGSAPVRIESPDSAGGPQLASEASRSAQETERSAFAALPDRETLGAAYAEIRGRTQSDVAIFVAAIRCHSAASRASMRALLQIVRAAMRSVDRIGCEDDSTLLICMPSVDAATAYDRNRQICRSATAIGFGKTDSGEHQVSVGVAEAGPDEKFPDVVSRALELAQQSQAESSIPVFLERYEVPA